jgi:hypothetical protein
MNELYVCLPRSQPKLALRVPGIRQHGETAAPQLGLSVEREAISHHD